MCVCACGSVLAMSHLTAVVSSQAVYVETAGKAEVWQELLAACIGTAETPGIVVRLMNVRDGPEGWEDS